MSVVDQRQELLEQIALPSRLGVALGEEIWGQPWKAFPFILQVEEAVVEACLREDTQDWFIVNCPNQVGKTSWAGVLLAFWYIGMFPDKQVIFISYSDSYSMDYGRIVRDLFRRHGQRLFGLAVDPQNDSAGDWKLLGHPSGGMLSVGIGGMITGRQGHLVLIDDVLRTMQDAASTTMKDAHWRDWKGTIYGRRQPGCVYVVTMTRLAEDDLSGRLKEEARDGRGLHWVEMNYPGICEPPDDYDGPIEEYRDSLGRKVGEPLETRFSRPTDTIDDNWWIKAKAELKDDALFDCMVQQNPKRDELGMFPRDRWVLTPRADFPTLYVMARGWDLASTKGGGDYTTGALIGKASDGDIYILGRVREQMGPDDGLARLIATAQVDTAAIPIVIEEEKSGAGKNLVAFYQRQTQLEGFTIVPSPVAGTKEQRATSYSILQKGGKVHLPSDPEDAEWVESWMKEHAGMMGNGRRPRHDDQIDAAAHAINYLNSYGVVEIRDPNAQRDMTMEQMLEMEEFLASMGIA
jgi:predicted phage terminase large subunit-like protein